MHGHSGLLPPMLLPQCFALFVLIGPIMIRTVTSVGGILRVALGIGYFSSISPPMSPVGVDGLMVSALLDMFAIYGCWCRADRFCAHSARAPQNGKRKEPKAWTNFGLA